MIKNINTYQSHKNKKYKQKTVYTNVAKIYIAVKQSPKAIPALNALKLEWN